MAELCEDVLVLAIDEPSRPNLKGDIVTFEAVALDGGGELLVSLGLLFCGIKRLGRGSLVDEFSVQRLQVKWPNGLLPVSNKPISSYLCTRRRKGAWVQCKKENTLHYMKIILMEIPGSTSCAIQPSWMGEHGGNWEDMENMENTEGMEKMENINQITYHSIYDSKHFFVTQNAEDGRESSKM